MSRTSTIRLSASLALLSLAGITHCAAADVRKVGQAELFRNEVVNVEGAQLIPIKVGDEVMRDAVIRTKADANARFGLIDNTKLTIGPGSELKIDRAVLANEARYKQISIRLTEGTFRFITGNSDKKSYRIETPTATIGVRGTILDIRISGSQTLVALQDGRANVCAGAKCTQLLERGHTANITREGGVLQIRRDLVPTWTFASVCSGNSALCAPLPALTRRASLLTSIPGTKALGNSAGNARKAAITRFCPDGKPMIGSTCAPTATVLRDTSLPRLNDPANDLPIRPNLPRDASLPLPGNTLPSIDNSLGRPSVPAINAPRLPVPGLGR